MYGPFLERERLLIGATFWTIVLNLIGTRVVTPRFFLVLFPVLGIIKYAEKKG